jgi:hypothetical protein
MTHAPSAKRAPPAPLYERDLYAWSREQARLLTDRRFGEIDAEHIAEEILEVGRTEYDKLESALRILLMHMLKWDYQPDRRSSSWEATIAVQRRHALRQLDENPSLKPRWQEAVRKAYADARDSASGETSIDLGEFPPDCPYDWEAITTRSFRQDQKS